MNIRPIIAWFTAVSVSALFIVAALWIRAPELTDGSHLPAMLSVTGDFTALSPGKRLISSIKLIPAAIKDAGHVPLVAAIVENHVNSRPQKGLEEAEAVFELIVEGGISRFMALYRGDRLPAVIEPIRSLRPHFVSVAAAFRPLLLHAGGSAIAYEALTRHPEITHHDGIRYDGETFKRDPSRRAPHNLTISREAIKKVLDKANIDKFDMPIFPVINDFPRIKSGRKAKNISVSFGGPDHDITYSYKMLSNSYARKIHGADRQAHPENVIILEAHIEGLGDPHAIPWTQTFGSGEMLLFAKGKVWRGTWKRKKGQIFRFYDSNGDVLPLEAGQVWITLLPDLDRVSWK